MVPNLRVVELNNIYRKVPMRKPNAEMRTREYLTPAEVEKVIAAAKLGRYGHPSSGSTVTKAEEDEFYRRTAGGPITVARPDSAAFTSVQPPPSASH